MHIRRNLLWVVQLVSLGIILVISWRLLDREVWALLAASITLFGSLYAEHRTLPPEDE
jgi:hypothetical protein